MQKITDAQRKLFQSAYNHLIAYANSRLNVVNQLDVTQDSPDERARVEIVARALWQHVEVIGDYVRNNPDKLDEEVLDIVRDLRNVVYDDFVYEGESDGMASFAHKTGVYQALCISDEWAKDLPDTPIIVRMALTPFMGSILLLEPVIHIGPSSQEHLSKLRRDALRSGSYGITRNGSTLAQRARSWQNKKKERRKKTKGDASKRGSGFHRGVLAGLDGLERTRAKQRHYDLQSTESGLHQQIMRMRSVEASYFPASLAEGLELLDTDWLMSIAQQVAELGEIPELPRNELIQLICEHTIHNESLRDMSLAYCENPQFELLERLMDTCPLSLVHLAPSKAEELFPMVPYAFILREHDSYVAWMPPEIRKLIMQSDLKAVGHIRERLSRAAFAAGALASLCGIISIDDAYDRYHAVDPEPLDRRQFELALIQQEACETRDSYALWDHDGTTYLVSASLSNQGALARVVRESYSERVIEPPASFGSCTTGYVPIAEEEEEDLLERLRMEQQWLQRQRLRLLDAKSDLAPRHLEPAMITQSFVSYLLETDPLLRVRDYVDRHIPDDEDDYEFPDIFCRAIIISAIFEHESYDEVLDVPRLFGMIGSEGSGYPHALGRLITDVFNALPCWTLNGWSLAENTERIAGRPMPRQAAS